MRRRLKYFRLIYRQTEKNETNRCSCCCNATSSFVRRHFEVQCSVAANSERRVLLQEHENKHSKIMATEEWSEAKCLQLVLEYRKRPILWDQKCPLYYKKTMRPQAWTEVGEVLNVAPEKCRRKMVILMSSFRREKAKYMHHLRNSYSPVNPFQSAWFAFNAMSFLLDKESERKLNLTEFIGCEDDSDTNTDEERTSTTKPIKQHSVENIKWVVRPPLDDNNAQDMHPQKSPKITVKDEQSLRSISSSEEQQLPISSQTNEDEITYFSNFIASKMMKYNEKTKNAVQQAICQIIFKADQHEQMQEPNVLHARSQKCSSQPSRPLLVDTSLLPGCSPITELNTDQRPDSNDVSIKLYYSDSD